MTETPSQGSLSPKQQQQPSSLRSSPLDSQSGTESHPDKETNQSAILTPSRTAYLPLVSPSIEEDGFSTDQNGLKRSREEGSGSYFDINKQESSTTNTSRSAILSDEDEEASIPTAKRVRIPLVSLPDEIGNPLMRAIEQSMSVDQSYKNGESSSSSAQQNARQHRAMSVPRNLRSKVHPVTALMVANRRPSAANSQASADATSERQRRNSVRAQQLSLLASQARLALSGTSNVNTAIRTENAVKGAVMKAFNDVQARKQRESISGSSSPLSNVQSERGESGSPVKESNKDIVGDQNPSPKRMEAIRDPTATWSEALQNAKSATSFLDSAKEVARDWANGFYAYEKEWIGTALQKEQLKLDDEKVQQEESRIGRRTSLSAPPVTAREEESTLTDKDMVIPVEPMKAAEDASSNYTASKAAVNAIPQKVVDSAVIPTRSIDFGNGGGKLVDVLSNFATLIDSHKEGCHSLEKLAHNARRLSAVQLPPVRFDTSATSTATTTIGSMSAVSSDAGSPMSVAGLMS
ncbi:uncharacterized protein FA14DRAFT_158647 [Meira miltonrushii]|uniref:Uncharacterized protein n=1 Tax=Meira miltonrushii TaxID=1280837 RepID=A0A316V2Q6_9BASI|nr:uncharacterized protein FA14DRAFT_158647 [Meira miltonrushii]PWN31836.1 hypothetical protein FA14DRAFT_158647 [Meira miltonrushii]